MYSSSEKLAGLAFYLISIIVLGGIAYVTGKNKRKRTFYSILFVISTTGLIFNTLWIISAYFPSPSLTSLVITLAGILLPIVWLVASLGFITYGTVAVVKRQTYVKYPIFVVPQKVNGIAAVYHGFLWIIAGLMMILIALSLVGFALCNNQTSTCIFLDAVSSTFSFLGRILIFFGTPLKRLNIM